MTVETFDASTTWICPAGIVDGVIQVELWGGGSDGDSDATGKGGGGGAYSRTNAYAVTEGVEYTVHCGAVGTFGPAGDTYFDTNMATLALGANADTGGVGTGGIGDVKFSGGNGGVAGITSGGGGGSSAGTGAAGVNGSDGVGGTGGAGGVAPSGGGDGGAGGDTGLDGLAASNPGGGGGGGGVAMTFGGAGRIGRVTLTYTLSEDAVLLLADDDGFAGVMNAGCADIADGYG